MDGFDSAANFGRQTGWWGNVFFIARHFGTGIIISTAFIVSQTGLSSAEAIALVVPRVCDVPE